MTTLARLRTAALALPEVTEDARSGTVEFAVRGRGFASVTDDVARLRLGESDVEAALAAHPAAERLTRGEHLLGLRVPLSEIDGMALNALVRASWFARAPKRLAAAQAAAEAGTDRPGDLPPGIGRPATGALRGAGIGTLDEVARHTAGELLALHGVGPKAVRLLAAALAERGQSLR